MLLQKLINAAISILLSIVTFTKKNVKEAIKYGNIFKEYIQNPAIDFVTGVIGRKVTWDDKVVQILRDNIDEVLALFSYLSIETDKILALESNKDKFIAFFEAIKNASYDGKTVGEIIAKLVGFAIDKGESYLTDEIEGFDDEQKETSGFWLSPIGQAAIKAQYDEAWQTTAA